jgi:hypothetical protein
MLKKKNIAVTILAVLGVLYAYRLYARRNVKVINDGSMEYEIEETENP